MFHCLTWSGLLTLIERAACFAAYADNAKKTTSGRTALDFALPADLGAYRAELDQFIAREIKPIKGADDNIRCFDHRRDWTRTDVDNCGYARHGWGERPAEVTRLGSTTGAHC